MSRYIFEQLDTADQRYRRGSAYGSAEDDGQQSADRHNLRSIFTFHFVFFRWHRHIVRRAPPDVLRLSRQLQLRIV